MAGRPRITSYNVCYTKLLRVKEGIKNDNLFEILAEELEEGREHFYSRVSADIADRDHLFDRAIVDVMIKQAGKIESSIW